VIRRLNTANMLYAPSPGVLLKKYDNGYSQSSSSTTIRFGKNRLALRSRFKCSLIRFYFLFVQVRLPMLCRIRLQ
jgi:hypothetical protein